VHLVGCVTDDVFGFLGPATAALAQSGVEQTVVLIDDLRFRRVLPRFHDSVELVLTPAVRNPFRRWWLSLAACREVLHAGPLKAMHLHGIVPCLIGASAARSLGAGVPLYYSPHGSKSLGPLTALERPLLWAIRTLFGRATQRAIANAATEARTLTAMSRQSVELVESPVPDTFFGVKRNEARHPLVVTGSRMHSPRSAELYAQLAVLLGGETLRLSFNWIGAADPGSMVRLKAANVGVFDVVSDSERASRLAAGWVYLAPGGLRGFPSCLVEAMSVGLPCVALDTPFNRDVIRHGETGLLCRSEQEILACIAQLLDERALRMALGRAARNEARLRFSEAKFRDSLFAAYDLPAS
jgi:glycosyltransferase involved in cell wall biosynthesis